MDQFWYFFIYSFFGFLLEVAFAAVTHSEKPDRKCFLLLPLCPVYGLGALGILAVSGLTRNNVFLTALAGALAATAAEYFADLFYEKVLGVSFWDYSGLPFNINGRVCLPFSLAWGFLSLALIYLVHPWVAEVTAALPSILTPAFAIFTLADGAVSMFLLKTTGTTDSLKWYAPEKESS